MIKLVDNNASAGISEFQWSSSEQVWPFERASDGSTLYCKEVSCGAGPQNGIKNVSHGISSLNLTKVFRLTVLGNSGASGIMTEYPYGNNGDEVYKYIDPSYVVIGCPVGNWSGYSFYARVLYAK